MLRLHITLAEFLRRNFYKGDFDSRTMSELLMFHTGEIYRCYAGQVEPVLKECETQAEEIFKRK